MSEPGERSVTGEMNKAGEMSETSEMRIVVVVLEKGISFDEYISFFQVS